MEEKRIPQAAAEFAIEERQRLLDRVTELELQNHDLIMRMRDMNAEQPSVVVLPERKDAWVEHGDGFYWSNGFNECLDEVTRLNSSTTTAPNHSEQVRNRESVAELEVLREFYRCRVRITTNLRDSPKSVFSRLLEAVQDAAPSAGSQNEQGK